MHDLGSPTWLHFHPSVRMTASGSFHPIMTEQDIIFTAGTPATELTTAQRHYVQYTIQQVQIDQQATFSGGEKDTQAILKWVRDMEEHFYGLFVQPELWVILAAVRLKGEARSWFAEVEKEHIFGDWNRFKTAFIEKWSPDYFHKVITAYHGIRQDEEETVDDFYAKFRLLRDNLPERDPESIAKVLFVNALRPGLHEIVVRQFHDSVESTYKTARLVMVLQDSVESSTRATGSQTQKATENFGDQNSQKANKATRTNKTIGVKACFLCNQTGHLVRDCPQYQAKFCLHCRTNDHSTADCLFKYGPNRKRDKKVPICYKCSESGHIARDCTYSPFGITYVRGQSTAGRSSCSPPKAAVEKGSDTSYAESSGSLEGAIETASDADRQAQSDGDDKLSEMLGYGHGTDYSPPSPITKCFRCREFGHLTQECTAPLEMSHIEYTSKDKCLRCKKRGHRDIDCPEPNTAETESLEAETHETNSVASADSVEPVDLIENQPVEISQGEVHSTEDLGFASE
ncbi:Hypothetical protein conserved in the Yarrowia clade [Yarrowia lipolytica]|uniref:CCHC-type domain-containing protein n=1 Tax=Yarrowia lipolytica TaxID=4952 RepID=A0A1D8N3K5_YARLL|nr:hypothetical protein YALI1_A03937g [Yarrowia lipolytica]VBB88826.1 Hypothetical protein conserved in the Yarrowia clade [Yarrowia lipolytica]